MAQDNLVLLEYYQEMGQILVDQNKGSQAIELYRKALKISQQINGEEHFTTFECTLNLATLLDKTDAKKEAGDLFKKCLSNFDKKDAQMMKGQEITDELENLSFNSSCNLSERIAKQQAALQRSNAFPHMHDKDATVIQRIGIYFREKQEYERACDLLERVLEIKKNLKVQQMNQEKEEATINESDNLDNPQELVDNSKLFLTRDFATLYNDLALTYQGMEELEFAQDYLIQAIQCLESDTEMQQSVELVESYIHLADLLRKQANIEQSIQSMLKAIEIEQDIPDRQLSLAESYK